MLANAITTFRTLLTLPLFAVLAFGGNAWLGLVLFLGCGALDVVDGQVARRLNQTSAFGGMLDLVGDRLLTFAAVAGLIVSGGLPGVHAVAGLVLIVRDLIVASLNEALPGKLGPRVSTLEMLKIAAAFIGLSLAITAPLSLFSAHQLAGWVLLWIAAVLTAITLLQYSMRALRAFAEK
ncbi:CDP-diacylglycerol--glycerol-3-phosphate 3-phosphatidyltransferase [alpha proteobacterium U9-1i]|nr:CDP-diacylglycerol--glycerol-3-phosphate 3-phosphatidyltransferase [alpha proteobacterium U9-1i]